MQDKMAGVHFLPLPQSYLKMRDEHAPQISALPPLPSPAPTSSHPALEKKTKKKHQTTESRTAP